FFPPEHAAHPLHGPEGGDSGRLVQDNQPAARLTGKPSPSKRKTLRFPSSRDPRTVQPAALRWPPPPCAEAMADTSTFPLERRLTRYSPASSSRNAAATSTPKMDRGEVMNPSRWSFVARKSRRAFFLVLIRATRP